MLGPPAPVDPTDPIDPTNPTLPYPDNLMGRLHGAYDLLMGRLHGASWGIGLRWASA